MSDQANWQISSSQNSSMRRRVLIVGGVAGGASCAARLRRLDESVEIVMFDRGPYVSFANCGLPYYVGNVISDERRLLVASREMFRDRFNIEVHTDTEVTGVDRSARTITVRDGRTGNSLTERYDALVLSPGAAPIRPPLWGRPPRRLRGAQHSRLTPHPFMDCRSRRQDRGRCRWRLHRLGDGRELDPS
jgi:NADPH-dependent 2,4-dienoyl-CoA reductase/sulfur reductase-like enzyme